MSTWLLVVVVAAALACPLHMLWSVRRGKRPVCCPATNSRDVDAAGARQRALAAQIERRASL